MTGGNLRKRKRPITSCSECYRRKQKCDRELPCAICTIRGIPDKCSFTGYFDDENGAAGRSPKRPATNNTDSHVIDPKPFEEPLVASQDLDEQLGYSSVSGSNFDILQKSLQHQDHSNMPIPQQHKSKIPEFVLYQISNIEKALPSQQSQDKLVDLYFQECWWWFTSLEPTAFRKQLRQFRSIKSAANNCSIDYDERDSYYFTALLLQVMGVALQHLNPRVGELRRELSIDTLQSADTLSIRYSKAGMQIMDLLGRHKSSVIAVQHDMIRGIWLKNFSRGTESWYSLGNAIRQAQELGLHKKQEPVPSLDTGGLNEWLWQDMLHQRVWACLFSWDAHVSFTLGRPRIINASDCARMNLVACEVPDDTRLSRPPERSDMLKPSMIEPIIFHYSMGYLIHEMLDTGADRSDLANYSIVDKLHKEMNSLQDGLPGYLNYTTPNTTMDVYRPIIPTMRLHIASLANTYITALHRAHVLRRRKSCEIALNAAMTTLQVQEQLFKITDRYRWRIYTYSFYTIDAAIFLGALLLETPSTLDRSLFSSITAALLQSLNRLEQMQDVSPMAKSGAKIIKKCYDRVKQSANNNYGVSTPNSDSTTLGPGSDTSIDLPNVIKETWMSPNASPSLRAWIEQMDQVMLPLLDIDAGGPFDNSLWDLLVET